MTIWRDNDPEPPSTGDASSLDRTGSATGPAAGFLQRVLILLLVVAIATVSVLAFRTLCVVCAGLLLGVVLFRLSRAVQRYTHLPYRAAFGAVILALAGFFAASGLFVIPRLGTQLNDLSSKLSMSVHTAIQAVENNLITPLVQRKAVSIPPVVLIVSQVLMGLMIGIVGVAIATPLAAVGLQLIRDLYIEEDSS